MTARMQTLREILVNQKARNNPWRGIFWERIARASFRNNFNDELCITELCMKSTSSTILDEYFQKNKINEKINEKCDYLRRRSLDEIVGKRALNLWIHEWKREWKWDGVSNRSAIISLELRNDDCLFAGNLITIKGNCKIVSRFRLFLVKRCHIKRNRRFFHVSWDSTNYPPKNLQSA